MNYYKLQVKIKTKAVDALVFHLNEMGIYTLQIVDNYISKEDLAKMYVNINGVSADDDYSTVVCYFEEQVDEEKYRKDISSRVNTIGEFIDVGDYQIEFEKIVGDDYLNNWKKFYDIIEIGDIAIVPAWKDYLGEKTVVKIDPSFAFGSGSHETTSLCIKQMQKLKVSKKKVLDIGCGSGILSIAASKMGADSITAIDIDELAIKATNNNILLNKVINITTKLGDISVVDNEKYDIVVANIIIGVLKSMKKEIINVLNKGSYLIMSGVLDYQQSELLEHFQHDFKVVGTLSDGEWIAVLLKYE